jgi:hypothetical protein
MPRRPRWTSDVGRNQLERKEEVRLATEVGRDRLERRDEGRQLWPPGGAHPGGLVGYNQLHKKGKRGTMSPKPKRNQGGELCAVESIRPVRRARHHHANKHICVR